MREITQSQYHPGSAASVTDILEFPDETNFEEIRPNQFEKGMARAGIG
jgi:hypothetical protein